MLRTPIFYLLVTFTLFAFSHQASASNVFCNGCTPIEVERKLFIEAPYQQGTYYYNVGNVQDNKAYRYKVRVYFDQAEFLIMKDITQLSVNTTFKNNVASVNSVLSTFRPTELPVDSQLKTSSDVFDNLSAQRIINDYVWEERGFAAAFATAVSHTGGAFTSSLEGIKITVTFADGSKVEVEASKLSDSNYDFKIDKTSVVDKFGNTVLEDVDDYLGKSISFDSGADAIDWLTDFIIRASAQGITMSGDVNNLPTISTTCKLVGSSINRSHWECDTD